MAVLVQGMARGSRIRLKHWLISSQSGIFHSRIGGTGQHKEVKAKGVAQFSITPRLEQQTKQVGSPQRLRIWIRPAVVTPPLEVPLHIPRPSYVGAADPPAWGDGFQVHDEAGIVSMRAAGQLAAQVRDFVGNLVQPGVTTDEIDKAAHKAIIEAGAYPSLLGYGRFPKSSSTSVNEVICNGIPDARPLREGDIISINVNVYLNGYHGETSETFICGKVHAEVKQFVEVTRDCLDTAIAVCGPGVDFREIGAVINDIADGCIYHVVEHVVGHGVGAVFQSAPCIFHDYNYKTGSMVAGQTFTIEPALSMGSMKALQWDDKWTTVTADGSLSAQFKHSLLITDSGVEVLTPKSSSS